MESSGILSIPLFTLEYDPQKACFLRKLPEGVLDLGSGNFEIEKKIYSLPQTLENKILTMPEIRGRDLLALVRRGYNPLIKAGPVLAERGDRIMELGLMESSAADPPYIKIILRCPQTLKQYPLDGLPNHRLCDNRIYEIIPEQIRAMFSLEAGVFTLTLRGTQIPEFGDNYARLIYMFADDSLYKLLAQENAAEENIFIDTDKISLIMQCRPVIEKGVGRALCTPVLQYGDKSCPAIFLSRQFRQKYIRLDDRWIRRETLEKTGIGPLDCFINGRPLEPFFVKAADLFFNPDKITDISLISGVPAVIETDSVNRDLWVPVGPAEKIFNAHLEFLRKWGIYGGVITEKTKAAALLIKWLEDLNIEAPYCRILLIMPKEFFKQEFSILWTAHRAVNGCELITYEELLETSGPNTANKKYAEKPPDILFVTEPETAVNDEFIFKQLEQIQCRLRLGLFLTRSKSGNVHLSEKLKTFFKIKGCYKKFENFIIRNTESSAPLELPSNNNFTNKTASEVLQGDCFAICGGRFWVGKKFFQLKSIGYRQLAQEDEDGFVEWRSQFKQGLNPAATTEFILVYARELILCMDAAQSEQPVTSRANYALAQLYRLWTSYCRIFPKAMEKFPSWLLDFSIIYHAEDSAQILMQAAEEALKIQDNKVLPPILFDLYLHKKYAEQNSGLQSRDLVLLVPKPLLPEFPAQSWGPLLTGMDEALAKADTALRTQYGKKLLEFFCPLPMTKNEFNCFEGIPGLGQSSYTAEWPAYSRHEPLIKFITNLAGFLQCNILESAGIKVRSRVQPGPVWKKLFGREKMNAQNETRQKTRYYGGLQMQKIRELREDSDAVLEMLKVENDYSENDYTKNDYYKSDFAGKLTFAVNDTGTKKKTTDIAEFTAGLEKTERDFLDLLSQDRSGGLEEFARSRNTMADFLIDEINSRFMIEYGDLLVETGPDGNPAIQEEYKEEVIWALTFQKG
ncbi:MAG: hypothetical protein FWD78_00635 [Treponema sp.]|nr:hypothetical protein [Treponema sp.]